jgi:DNA-binding CsgD family transcriptional regulator
MRLSARESQILGLLQSGQTNKEIGLILGISQHTVRDYISALFLRYSVKSRAALAALYMRKSMSHRGIGPNIERRAVVDRRARPADESLQT